MSGARRREIDPGDLVLLPAHIATPMSCSLALHGGRGEDGTIQAMLDRSAFPTQAAAPWRARLRWTKISRRRCFAPPAS